MQTYNGETLIISILAGWIPAGQTGTFQIVGYIFPNRGDGKPILIEKTIAYNGGADYTELIPLTDGTLESFRIYWKTGGSNLQGLPVAVLVQIATANPYTAGTTLVRRTVCSGYMYQTSPLGYPESKIEAFSNLPMPYVCFPNVFNASLVGGVNNLFFMPARTRMRFNDLNCTITQSDGTADAFRFEFLHCETTWGTRTVTAISHIISMAGFLSYAIMLRPFEFVSPYQVLTAYNTHVTSPPIDLINNTDGSLAVLRIIGGDGSDDLVLNHVGCFIGYA